MDTPLNNDLAETKDLSNYQYLNNIRFAVEAANVGTWFMDVATRVFIPSARMKELHGYLPDEEMSFENAMAQVEGKYKSRVRSAIEQALTKKQLFNIEYPVTGFHNQRRLWVKALGALVNDPEGNISHFSGVLLDITEQKKSEQLRSKFIGIVSHELKTPLTALKAYVQMLNGWARKQKDSFSEDILPKVDRQVTKMTNMINSFLNVSHLRSGKIKLSLQTFNLNDLVAEAIEETRLVTVSHMIVLEPCTAIPVKADREKIEQVVINLLNNAAKYSPQGTLIGVSCELEENMAVVHVKDAGIGIAPEHQDKLFEEFYRVDTKETEGVSGFGIGLYLCSEIVNLHGGKIWLKSEVGRGSEFSFSLPLE